MDAPDALDRDGVIRFTELVFGNREKALSWLNEPDGRLEKTSPMSMLGTEAGCRIINSMLWQIDEGIFI
jgi:uncharacterized protein (DUF2384 family)